MSGSSELSLKLSRELQQGRILPLLGDPRHSMIAFGLAASQFPVGLMRDACEFDDAVNGHILLSTKLTDRCPDEDVIRSSNVAKPDAQAEVESGAAVRVILLGGQLSGFVSLISSALCEPLRSRRVIG